LPKPPKPVCNGVTVSAATLAMRDCAAVQSGPREAACALGLLVRDAIAGDSPAVSDDAERLAAALVLQLAKAAGATLTDKQAKDLAEAVLDFLSGKKDLNAALADQPLVGEVRTKVESALKVFARLHAGDIAAGSLLAAAAGGEALCRSPLGTNMPLCHVFGALTGTGGEATAADLAAIGQAFFKKDYGLAVGVATDLALGTQCTWLDPCPDDGERKKRVNAAKGTFIDELAKEFVAKTATFMVDAELSSSQASDVGQQVVAAAAELLSETDTGGIQRKDIGWGLILPTIGLRYGYSPGHINAAGQSTMRGYPTVDFVSLHHPFYYSANWYLGLHVSVLDALAPLAEASDRPASSLVSGDEVKATWLGFVAPRADLVVGFPFLSNRLVAGAGVGAHPYRLVPLPAPRFTYCFFGDTCLDNGNKTLDPGFLEFSLSVKLVL